MLVFLFTDLEGSTQLWERHSVEMRSALARHDAVLRRAVTSANGTVVKTTGDGLMAVFSSVPSCVEACLAGQRTITATTWDTDEPLRVRMGINVGEVEQRDGDFHGTAVNRAARIMAAGHGGQVLLSGIAAALARDSLPPGATLRDLGAHRLKDLAQPEQLFQLVHADLEADFPPLATIDARPNNLPVQVSEFLGREAELAAVSSMLELPGTRLVTLIGPGGTGKTRLALQVAAELADRYRDGVFFVDLSSERDGDATFEAIVRDLGLTGTREGPPLQVLKVKLHDQGMLIILDNFEQVTDAAVGVAELLQHCPRLVVMVTSRESLRLRGEQVFPVPPLSVPDPQAPVSIIAGSEAVSLFTARARSVRRGFMLIEENAAAVAEISIRLDGLPLAIELAAARLKVFTPNDLRDRLRHSIDVLGGGARDLPARQRTLRDTIAWSYELLGEDECRVFELMSVFATARLEAVEEVTAAVYGDLDVLDVLASLVDKSLVRSTESEESQRFSMLLTIREYAAARLAEVPEVEAIVRLAHARFYSHYASGLRPALDGQDREAALQALSSEIGNLRSAWRYWVEAGDLEQLYLLLDGLWALHDARGWYHAAIELTTDLLGVLSTAEPSSDRDQQEMTLRTSLGRALMAVRGYTVEVEREFSHALELSSSAGTAAQHFPVLRALASYYLSISDFAKTTIMGQRLLDLAEREQVQATLVEGHLVFGLGTAFGGNIAAGLRHLDVAIELFDPEMHGPGRFRLGTSPGVVARIASAFLLWESGTPDTGAARASEALDLARNLNHSYSLAYALYHVGFLDLNRQRLETARQRAVELAAVAGEHDYHVWKALASVLHGVAMCGLGMAEEGLALTEAGNDLYRGLTTPPVFWPPLLGLRSSAFAMAGRPQRALELIEEAIAASGSDEATFPEFRTLRGDILSMSPDANAAGVEESYREAIHGARTIGARLTELSAATRLVGVLRAQGRSPDGTDDLRMVYETFTEGFDEPELVAARVTLGIETQEK